MYSGDTQYGSTPDKAHAWGALPYGASGRVPLLSHWFWDVAPFYACCEWQDDDHDCFYYYIKRRTSPSCQTYQPPGHGRAIVEKPLLGFFPQEIVIFCYGNLVSFPKDEYINRDLILYLTHDLYSICMCR